MPWHGRRADPSGLPPGSTTATSNPAEAPSASRVAKGSRALPTAHPRSRSEPGPVDAVLPWDCFNSNERLRLRFNHEPVPLSDPCVLPCRNPDRTTHLAGGRSTRPRSRRAQAGPSRTEVRDYRPRGTPDARVRFPGSPGLGDGTPGRGLRLVRGPGLDPQEPRTPLLRCAGQQSLSLDRKGRLERGPESQRLLRPGTQVPRARLQWINLRPR